MARPEPLPPVLDDEEVRQLANESGMPGQGEYWTWTEARYFAWVVEQAVLRKIQPIKYCECCGVRITDPKKIGRGGTSNDWCDRCLRERDDGHQWTPSTSEQEDYAFLVEDD